MRIALGSSRGAVAGLVIRQGGVWMALGLLLGAAGVFATTRLVRTQLFGVPEFDPLTIGAAVVVLLVCAGPGAARSCAKGDASRSNHRAAMTPYS